jgi:hypothetical protein
VNFLTCPHFTQAHAVECGRSISRMRPRAYSALSLIVVRISRNGFSDFSSSMMGRGQLCGVPEVEDRQTCTVLWLMFKRTYTEANVPSTEMDHSGTI